MSSESEPAASEPGVGMGSKNLRLDLHIHSDASPDSSAACEDIIAAVKAAGLHGLALTDHNSIANNKRMGKLARKAGLLFIPGCEISSAKGHILTYGMEREMPKNLPPAQVVRMTQLSGCLALASHPFRLVTGLGPILSMDLPFDGLEVLNAHSSPAANAKADTLANSIRVWRKEAPREDLYHDEDEPEESMRRDDPWDRTVDDDGGAPSKGPIMKKNGKNAKPGVADEDMPLAAIGGSDAHTADRAGLAWTEFPGLDPDSATVEEVIEALRRGECQAGGRSSARMAMDYQFKVVWNRLKRGLKRI